MEDRVFCKLCGEWVQPIYGGECPNCGEGIPDYEFEEDFDWDEESDIILSDIGTSGKLYGYETMPEPVNVA